jgi:REP element-mobilizing transposase RayT
MGRRPRIDLAGFHHVVNRGIKRNNVYKSDEDKYKFLEIMCKSCEIYKVNIHDYCLMDNHYHLLIETTSENLSLFMRQINSNYAKYFNKKYKRSGYLWQGRYSSWYITDEKYLYDLFRYIEHNPIEANMSKKIGEYPFTLLASIVNKNQEVIECAKYSKLKSEIEQEGIQEHLEMALTKKERKELEKEQNKKPIKTEYGYKYAKEKTLREHFNMCETKRQRNDAIINAIEDGYKQIEVAKYLKLSNSAISKIVLETIKSVNS